MLNHTATDYSIAANITGSGQLFALSGTTILTGTNSYTGGTPYPAVRSRSARRHDGLYRGDITDNATLAFNRSDDVTFADAISVRAPSSRPGRAR